MSLITISIKANTPDAVVVEGHAQPIFTGTNEHGWPTYKASAPYLTICARGRTVTLDDKQSRPLIDTIAAAPSDERANVAERVALDYLATH